MTNTNQNTEVVVTYADSDNNKIHFEVPAQWLQDLMITWATEDASDVENDVETYIKGQAENLYEELEYSLELANNVYDVAKEEGVIISCKEIEFAE